MPRPPRAVHLEPDPATMRHAVAAEPGTTVLSFGGPATFTPSAWEWGFRADPLIDFDPEQARAIIEDGARARGSGARAPAAIVGACSTT
jgi:hypothetical protein